jgi:[NiFe] hydrogenase assembly HybE family chaperone
MSPRSRNAAFQVPQPPSAIPLSENPAMCLESMFLEIWTTSMRDLPFVNAALSVEAVGFRRWNSSRASVLDPQPRAASTSEVGCALGDWVGAVITPWFINLFVLPGGGNLWSDRRSGEHCQINFPIGPLEFIADYSPSAVIPSYQYCPLFAPPSQIASQSRRARRRPCCTRCHVQHARRRSGSWFEVCQHDDSRPQIPFGAPSSVASSDADRTPRQRRVSPKWTTLGY